MAANTQNPAITDTRREIAISPDRFHSELTVVPHKAQ
jgi:hypothetical protein